MNTERQREINKRLQGLTQAIEPRGTVEYPPVNLEPQGFNVVWEAERITRDRREDKHDNCT